MLKLLTTAFASEHNIIIIKGDDAFPLNTNYSSVFCQCSRKLSQSFRSNDYVYNIQIRPMLLICVGPMRPASNLHQRYTSCLPPYMAYKAGSQYILLYKTDYDRLQLHIPSGFNET